MEKTKKISKSQQKLCPISKNEEEFPMTACGGIQAEYITSRKESMISSSTKGMSTSEDKK